MGTRTYSRRSATGEIKLTRLGRDREARTGGGEVTPAAAPAPAQKQFEPGSAGDLRNQTIQILEKIRDRDVEINGPSLDGRNALMVGVYGIHEILLSEALKPRFRTKRVLKELSDGLLFIPEYGNVYRSIRVGQADGERLIKIYRDAVKNAPRIIDENGTETVRPLLAEQLFLDTTKEAQRIQEQDIAGNVLRVGSNIIVPQPAISPEDRLNGRVRAPRQTVSPDVARDRAAAKLEAARQMNPGLSDNEALDRYNDRMDDYNS